MQQGTTPLLIQFLEEGLKGKAASTIATYKTELIQFEKWLVDAAGTDLCNFARSDVQQYIDFLTVHKKAASTINKSWSAIKKFSKWVGNQEAINDIRVIKPRDFKKEAPKSLNRIERNKLIREVDRYGSKRDYAIIITLLNTGLRISELVALDRDDIQISERKGTMRVIGKGNKERTVPLNAETRRALTLYLDERKDQLRPLFLSNYRKRISKRSAQRVTEKYGFHAHQLRHTFITKLVRKGVDFSLIQSLTGHESMDMIARYSAPTEEDKAIVIEELFID